MHFARIDPIDPVHCQLDWKELVAMMMAVDKDSGFGIVLNIGFYNDSTECCPVALVFLIFIVAAYLIYLACHRMAQEK